MYVYMYAYTCIHVIRSDTVFIDGFRLGLFGQTGHQIIQFSLSISRTKDSQVPVVGQSVVWSTVSDTAMEILLLQHRLVFYLITA